MRAPRCYLVTTLLGRADSFGARKGARRRARPHHGVNAMTRDFLEIFDRGNDGQAGP